MNNDTRRRWRWVGWLLGVICLGCLSINPVYAHNVDDLEQWSMVTLDAHVAPKVRVYLEAQPRVGDNLSHMDRLLLRGAVGYQVTPHLSLWQGYAWTPSFQSLNVAKASFVSNYNDESRIYQQALLEHQWRRFTIVNRTRLEERFIDNAGETAVRARHMLRILHPIGHSMVWSWVVQDELLMNLNDTPAGPEAGFDQNRLFVGVNRKLSKHAALEVGYMNNPVNVVNQSVNRMNHIILAWLSVKF